MWKLLLLLDDAAFSILLESRFSRFDGILVIVIVNAVGSRTITAIWHPFIVEFTAGLLSFGGSFNIIVEFHRKFAPPALKAFSLRWLCRSHDSDGSRIGVKSTPAPVWHIPFGRFFTRCCWFDKRRVKESIVSPSPPLPPWTLDRYESQQFFSYFLFFHPFLFSFDTHF